MTDPHVVPPTEEPVSDRRSLLGKAAIAAAVTSVVGVSMAKRVGAANGDTMIVGGSNTATQTTDISGGTSLRVTNGASSGIGGHVPRNGTIIAQTTGAAAIIGSSTDTSGFGVYGRTTGSAGRGVYGLSDGGSGGVGVYGEHWAASTESGTGVYGRTSTGTGVRADATSGTGLVASGSVADARLSGSGKLIIGAAGFSNPPTGASTVGTLSRDSAGNLWYSPASGVYRKLAGSGSAGAFHAVTPGRVYDSRTAEPTGAPLVKDAERTVSVAARRDSTTGAVVDANFIPAGATAITCNVTVVNTASGGFLTINPGGTINQDTAAVNWSGPSQILNNGVTLTLNNNRELSVICGGSGGAQTDFVIDVTGYFL